MLILFLDGLSTVLSGTLCRRTSQLLSLSQHFVSMSKHDSSESHDMQISLKPVFIILTLIYIYI